MTGISLCRATALSSLILTTAGAFAQSTPDGSRSQLLNRGKYISDISGCADCHTPMRMGAKGPEPDLARSLSGHPEQLVMPVPPKFPEGPWVSIGSATNTAFAGPWGISYAINLTPDEQTGMGKWREQEFIQAMRTGKHLGTGRPIAPPMPWPAYRHMSDGDLKALFAYLKSLKPISNKVPDFAPPKS